MKPRSICAMRRGFPPVTGTVNMEVGVCCSELPAPSLREKYTSPVFRPTNSARTLPGTISLFLRVAISMATMPAVPSAITKRPSGVMLF